MGIIPEKGPKMPIDETQTADAAKDLRDAAREVIFAIDEGFLGSAPDFRGVENLRAAIERIEGKSWKQLRRPMREKRARMCDLLYPEREAHRGKSFCGRPVKSQAKAKSS
jgi:hypothetical protein